MKRIIKFWGNYNDNCEFSNCSTKYEVLPIVVDDAATDKELIELALSNNWELVQSMPIETKQWNHGRITLTHAIQLKETKLQDTGVYIRGREEARIVYLGLVTIPECKALPIHEGTDKAVTKDQAFALVDNQECSIAYTCDLDNEYMLVMEGWDYYHALPFLGYSLESFEAALGVDSRTFEDEVTSCGDCGEYMWNTDGYNYNYRIVDECELLGIECGCYEQYCLNNIKPFVNNSKKAIELDVAEKLETQGKIKHVERFIGGMVDGRGGSFGGESVREGQPESVLAELKSKYPKRNYVFTRDESGQFQTYFSVWQVKGKIK